MNFIKFQINIFFMQSSCMTKPLGNNLKNLSLILKEINKKVTFM